MRIANATSSRLDQYGHAAIVLFSAQFWFDTFSILPYSKRRMNRYLNTTPPKARRRVDNRPIVVPPCQLDESAFGKLEVRPKA